MFRSSHYNLSLISLAPLYTIRLSPISTEIRRRGTRPIVFGDSQQYTLITMSVPSITPYPPMKVPRDILLVSKRASVSLL